MTYDHKSIEKKWQERWEKEGVFNVPDKVKPDKKKYILDMFPYPSGAGLHVGHPEGYAATDIYSRYLRMKGFQVLHPMGWDAFGLPAENYAIKSGIHPKASTENNIKTFTRQIKSLGFSYDWSREVNTSDPNYYKWTQWLFLQLYKHGLAYKKAAPVNWCADCQTVLANEQVVDGACERCHNKVVQKNLEQWFFKITGEGHAYAKASAGKSASYPERLLSNLEKLDWPEPIKTMQRNWIGKSEGAELEFPVVANQTRKKCLIIHGVSGNDQENWFPWLNNFLQTNNWEIAVPNLPNADHPDVEEWNQVLLNKTKNADENSVIIGHSLGAPAALHLLQSLNRRIGKLILVAPVNPRQDWTGLKTGQPTLDWEAVKRFADIKIDWKKIRQLAGRVIIYYSDNDQYIPQQSISYYKENLPEAVFNFLPGKGHFNTSSGSKEFPEIIDDLEPRIKVFTTRPDTLYGATYMVLAPEHALVQELKNEIANWPEVEKYIKTATVKTQLERTDLAKAKTGVELKGVKAINPANNEEIPVWIADYVLSSYGTGAIMAVPAHDERDFEFAKKYNLPVKQVIEPCFIDTNSVGAVRPEQPFVERNAVICIVKHWQEEKYIGLKWKKVDWQTFITGGIEKSQTAEEAGKAEIEEETGFTGARFINHLGRVHSQFWHVPKKENRFAHFDVLYFELDNGNHHDISGEEKENHELAWLTQEEMTRFIYHPAQQYAWSLLGGVGEALDERGIMVNSEKFNGLESEEAKWKITKKVGGEKAVQYKLRDWLISRQRYWGAPIPIIYCDKCGEQAVSEKDLPVELSDDVDFRPKGESPLARSESFHKVKCPKCGGRARRESDTMDTFVDSSWYFLRYTDPKNDKEFASKEKIKAWLPVDTYVGGAEHAVLHLMYARFIYMVLYDLGLLGGDLSAEALAKADEPFLQLRNQGLILGPDGQKMSKSRGNVINPDEVVENFGADTMRMYEMFMGPLEDAKPWDTNGIIGVRRFLDRVWEMTKHQTPISKHQENTNNQTLRNIVERELHKLIKKVGEDIETFNFNTAVSQFMIFVNTVYKAGEINSEHLETFLKVLSPFAPHIANELWEKLGRKDLIEREAWPQYDASLLSEDKITYAVQVNGKVRSIVVVDATAGEDEVAKVAKKDAKIAKNLEGKKIVKMIFVKERLVNFVVKS